MELGTILATTGLLAAGNYAVWGPNSEENFHNATKFTNKQYDTYLRPTIEKLLGLRRKDITVEKIHRQDGKVAYLFKNVSTVDLENLYSRLGEKTKKPDLKIRENYLKEKKEQVLNVEEKLEDKTKEKKPKKDSKNKEKLQYYNIEIVSLSDDPSLKNAKDPEWNLSKEFKITVEREGETGRVTEDKEYELVLETLNRSLKVSLDLPLLSDQNIRNNITDSIGGPKIKNFWQAEAGVKTQEPLSDSASAQSEHANKTNFVNELAELAINPKEFEATQPIIDRHTEIDELIENEIKKAEEARDKINQEIKRRKTKKQQLKNKAKATTVTGSILSLAPAIVIAVLVVSLLSSITKILLTIFFPEAATAATLIQTIVSPVSTFLSERLVNAVLGTGLTTLTFGIFKQGINEYKLKKDSVKDAVKDREKLTSTIEKLEADRKNLLSMTKGAVQTLEITNKLPNHPEILDLSNNEIGDIGVVVACKHLANKDEIRSLNLANNSITDIGAKELANVIKNIQTSSAKNSGTLLFTIDLTNNKIGNDGLATLSDALKNNFTVTNLTYDIRPDTNKETIIEINRQLLINYYLRGQKSLEEIRSTMPILDAFPGDDTELHEEAIAKLRNNFNITAFPPSENKVISEMANNITEQNIVLHEVASSIADTKSNTNDINDLINRISQASTYQSNRFEYEAEIKGNAKIKFDRCITFLKKQLTKDDLIKKRAKIAASDNINTKQKIAALTILDMAKSDEQNNYVGIKQRQLKTLLDAQTENPTENPKQAFSEFMEIYKDIPEDLVYTTLHQLDKKNIDQITNIEQIRSYNQELSEEHINSLLKTYIKCPKNPDSQNKIALLAHLLKKEDLPNDFFNQSFYKEYLSPKAIMDNPQKDLTYTETLEDIKDIISKQYSYDNKIKNYWLTELDLQNLPSQPPSSKTSPYITKRLSEPTPIIPTQPKLAELPKEPIEPPSKNILKKALSKVKRRISVGSKEEDKPINTL